MLIQELILSYYEEPSPGHCKGKRSDYVGLSTQQFLWRQVALSSPQHSIANTMLDILTHKKNHVYGNQIVMATEEVLQVF